jgi:hypothetical protein
MPPNLLLSTGRESADPQNILHLLIANEQDAPGHEPPQPLRAWRAGKTAAVAPELAEPVDLLERKCRIEGDGNAGLGVVEANVLRQLVEEWRVGVTRVDADADHSARVSSGVDVDVVQLGFGAVALHGVICRSVDVPAVEVHRLFDTVFGKSRSGKLGEVFEVFAGQVDARTISPILEAAGDVGQVVEVQLVLRREALVETERDGRLLGAGLAEFVC